MPFIQLRMKDGRRKVIERDAVRGSWVIYNDEGMLKQFDLDDSAGLEEKRELGVQFVANEVG